MHPSATGHKLGAARVWRVASVELLSGLCVCRCPFNRIHHTHEALSPTTTPASPTLLLCDAGYLSAIAPSAAVDFYGQLFDSLIKQGMTSFTQDFLDFQGLLFPAFLQSPEVRDVLMWPCVVWPGRVWPWVTVCCVAVCCRVWLFETEAGWSTAPVCMCPCVCGYVCACGGTRVALPVLCTAAPTVCRATRRGWLPKRGLPSPGASPCSTAWACPRIC
jgi:hypothetical protein